MLVRVLSALVICLTVGSGLVVAASRSMPQLPPIIPGALPPAAHGPRPSLHHAFVELQMRELERRAKFDMILYRVAFGEPAAPHLAALALTVTVRGK